MPKVPAYNRSLNLVKGEPDKKKIKPTVIDRAKYQSVLDKPLDAGADNFVSSDPEAFVPAVLEPNGFNYYSGTIKGKDAVYKKGNNYYMYNEKPSTDGGASNYGLVNIGDLSEPKQMSVQDSIPKVSPQVIDPMKVEGFNGMKAPIVEQYKNGGKVRGLAFGGDVEYDNGMSTDANMSATSTPATGYNAAMQGANAKNQKKQQDKIAKDNTARNANIKQGANVAGKALGAYGTGYFASRPEDDPYPIHNKGMAVVGQLGPIGGAAAGLDALITPAAMGTKRRAEQTENEGNLLNEKKARNTAMWGSLASPSRALETRSKYKGGWTDISGKGYARYLEKEAKDKIQAERDAEIAATNQQATYTNDMKIQNALAAREAGDTSFKETLVTPTQKTYSDLNSTSGVSNSNKGFLGSLGKFWNRGEENDNYKKVNLLKKGGFKNLMGNSGMAEGGVVSGKGTAKSDSINAKVEAGSFIVPAENAPIAKELAAKVLRKVPSKKANLNQKGQTDVRLSDGEYMFTPEEKQELIANGIDLEALAPNAKDDLINHLKCGGDVKGYAKGGGVQDPPKKSEDRLYREKSVQDYMDEYNKNGLRNLGPSFTPNIRLLQDLQDKYGNLDDEQYAKAYDMTMQGLGKINDLQRPYLYEDFSDVEGHAKGGEVKRQVPSYKYGTDKKGVPPSGVTGIDEKAERAKIEAQRKAEAKRIGEVAARQNAEAAKRQLAADIRQALQVQLNAQKRTKAALDKAQSELSALEKSYKDYEKESDFERSRKTTSGEKLIGSDARPSAEKVRKDKEELLSKINVAKANLEKAQKGSAFAADEKNYTNTLPKVNTDKTQYVPSDFKPLDYGLKQGEAAPLMTPEEEANAVAALEAQEAKRKVPAKGKAAAKAAAVDNSSLAFDPSKFAVDDTTLEVPSNTPMAAKVAADNQALVTEQAAVQSGVDNANVVAPASTPKKQFDYGSMLGSALNYGIPALQTGLGLRALKKAGDRPVDSLSPEYLATIAKTSGDVEAARQQAKYGFTGEQLAQAKMENNALTNSGRAFARNVAGGSGAVGLNAERAVLNDAFGRALSTRVQDKNLQLAKQQDAFNRQQGLNAMIADKQDRLRQYFGDDMNAWQQKTSSAAGLVNTGLTNAIDSYRADQRLKHFKENTANS